MTRNTVGRVWVLSILFLIGLFWTPVEVAVAQSPSCKWVTAAELNDRRVWDLGDVICYGIDIPPQPTFFGSKTFTVEVRALDSRSTYDVYMDPVPTVTGQVMQTQINLLPISRDRGTVRYFFTPDTVEFGRHYTVALVPRPGYRTGDEASIRFSNQESMGRSAVPFEEVEPVEDGDIIIVERAVNFFNARLDPGEQVSFPFQVFCRGDIDADLSFGRVGSSSKALQPTAMLVDAVGQARQSWPAGNPDQGIRFPVSLTHIRRGTEWGLFLTNQGTTPFVTSIELRKPGDDCPESEGIETVTLQQGSGGYSGMRDTTLEQATPTANFGNHAVCYVDGNDGNGVDRSTLLAWDISSIPEDSEVLAAKIHLRIDDEAGENDFYGVYGVKKQWVESQATWTRRRSNSSWSSGGAKGPTDRGSQVGRLVAEEIGWQEIRLDTDLVQGWVNNPASNFGVIIAHSTENNGIDFFCSETSVKANRPKLEITYR